MNDTSNFDQIIPWKGNDKIFVGNCQGLKICHTGNASFDSDYGKFRLNDILVVTRLKKKILSIKNLKETINIHLYLILIVLLLRTKLTKYW